MKIKILKYVRLEVDSRYRTRHEGDKQYNRDCIRESVATLRRMTSRAYKIQQKCRWPVSVNGCIGYKYAEEYTSKGVLWFKIFIPDENLPNKQCHGWNRWSFAVEDLLEVTP
jgi:hypothetical protein